MSRLISLTRERSLDLYCWGFFLPAEARTAYVSSTSHSIRLFKGALWFQKLVWSHKLEDFHNFNPGILEVHGASPSSRMTNNINKLCFHGEWLI